ncbi:MAG: leucine-rich repeat domain-containing protein, partial [Simkaniaceae bacterium]|nr:leucine-rich repeat domain-containing protein [Simkaniaceae bacterium]
MTTINTITAMRNGPFPQILELVGDPQVTSLVSRSWREHTRGATNSSLFCMGQVMPGKPTNVEEIRALFLHAVKEHRHLVPREGARIYEKHPLLSRGRCARIIDDIFHAKENEREKFWMEAKNSLLITMTSPDDFQNVNADELIRILVEKFGNQPLVRAYGLYITDKQLRHLSEDIGMFVGIASLSLSLNCLSFLPREVEQLTALRSLNLSNNSLEIFPSEILGLSKLKQLDLSYNELAILPSEIGNLRQLESLNLEGNQLQVLPMEMGELANLTNLELAENVHLIGRGELWGFVETGRISYRRIVDLKPEFKPLCENLLRLTKMSSEKKQEVYAKLVSLASSGEFRGIENAYHIQ